LVAQTVKYNLARIGEFVKHKQRKSLSVNLIKSPIKSLIIPFNPSCFSFENLFWRYIYAKAKLCFKKTKPPKLCGDFLLLELQTYGGIDL